MEHRVPEVVTYECDACGKKHGQIHTVLQIERMCYGPMGESLKQYDAHVCDFMCFLLFMRQQAKAPSRSAHLKLSIHGKAIDQAADVSRMVEE